MDAQLTADHYVGTDAGVRHAMLDFLAGLSFVAVMTSSEALMWYDELSSSYRLITTRELDSSPNERSYAIRRALKLLGCENFNRLCGGDIVVSASDIVERTRFTVDTADSERMLRAMRAFTSAVEAMDPPERRRLLQFWTGASSLSHDAKLEVVLLPTRDRGRLPTARTCYMQLVLHYPTGGGGGDGEGGAELLQHLRTAMASSNIIYDDY